MLQEFFLHPTGQIPAYEWHFSDMNPPVHAWATIFLYRAEQGATGKGDIDFLKRSFSELMLNFSWWVNRKYRFGNKSIMGCRPPRMNAERGPVKIAGEQLEEVPTILPGTESHARANA